MQNSSLYQQTVEKELATWEAKMASTPRFLNRISKGVQTKLQSLIPQKGQDIITAAIKTTIEFILYGSNLITKTKKASEPTLAESEFLVERAFNTYYSHIN